MGVPTRREGAASGNGERIEAAMSVTEQRASAFAPEAVPLGIEPGTLNEALFSFGWNESGTAGCERQEGKKRREAPLLSARSKSSKGVAHGGESPCVSQRGSDSISIESHLSGNIRTETT